MKNHIGNVHLKPSKPINYRSDGTGRDSYVIQNSGGLVSDYRSIPVEQNFKSSLRFNPQSPLKVSSDKPWGAEITDFLNWRTPKDQMAIRQRAKQQRALLERLSPSGDKTFGTIAA